MVSDSLTELAIKLHQIFLSNFGGDKPHLVTLNHNKDFNAQYRCPYEECPTNIVGHHSYGKYKLSVTFGIWKYHWWVCSAMGSVSYIANEFFSDVDKKFVNDARKEFRSVNHDHEVKRLNHLNKEVIDGFQKLINFDDDFLTIAKTEVIRYALRRGLTFEHMHFYDLMYAPSGKYANSLIIPSYDASRHMNYFIARNIYKTTGWKYTNPDNVNKTSIIFNEHLVDWNRQVILVEGPIDYLKLHGFNRTLLFGSQLSNKSPLMEKLIQYKPAVKLMLDPDAQEKSYEIAERLMRWNIPVCIVTNYLIEAGVEDAGALTPETKELVVGKALNASATVDHLSLLRERLNNI